MPDIEHYVVERGVVDIMDSDNQLDCSETGSQMPRIPGAAADHIVPYFSAECHKFLCAESPDVGRVADLVKKTIHSFYC